MNSFNRHVLEWCKLHHEDPTSAFIIRGFKESAAMKKAERKRWRLISKAMLALEEVAAEKLLAVYFADGGR